MSNANLDRTSVCIRCVLIATDPIKGVARHMDQMTGVGRKHCQPVRIAFGESRLSDCLGCVNVEVDCRSVISTSLENAQ